MSIKTLRMGLMGARSWPRRVLSVSLLFALTPSAVLGQTDLAGIWELYVQAEYGEVELTEHGMQQRQDYNFLTDDPALWCSPASIVRVYSNPASPVEFIQQEDNIVIRYEFLDLVRTIPITDQRDPDAPVSVAGHPILGKSIGRYEDDVLVVETRDYEAGFVSTLGKTRAIGQSKQLVTVERYRRDGDRLHIEIYHEDPLVLAKPLTVKLELAWLPDTPLLEYGCTLEGAGYEEQQTQ